MIKFIIIGGVIKKYAMANLGLFASRCCDSWCFILSPSTFCR